MSVSKLDAKRFWHKHILGHKIQIHGTCTWLIDLENGVPVGSPARQRIERVCECGATWPAPHQDDTWRLMAFFSCMALLSIAACLYILFMDG